MMPLPCYKTFLQRSGCWETGVMMRIGSEMFGRKKESDPAFHNGNQSEYDKKI